VKERTSCGDWAIFAWIDCLSTRDVLVDMRAALAERAKHTLLPASVTRSSCSAIKAGTAKQIAMIASSTETAPRARAAGCLQRRSAIVCHVIVLGDWK
jgi:hypothetical protein